jgi:xylulokinase
MEQSPDARTTMDARLTALADDWPAWPLCIPHLAGSGSVSNDPAAVGTLFGLTFEKTRDDLLRSVLEGITLELALNLEALAQAAGLSVGSLRGVIAESVLKRYVRSEAVRDRTTGCN